MPGGRNVLFIFKLPKNKKQYLRLVRSLFGRNEKGYRDKGLFGEIKGIKLSSNVFMIPKEYQQKAMEFLQKEKADYSMKEICVFGEEVQENFK